LTKDLDRPDIDEKKRTTQRNADCASGSRA